MSEADKLFDSVKDGDDARALLEHPLTRRIFADMSEKTTQALLGLPVEANEERLALCTVLRVMRGMPAAMERVAETGRFDALRLAQLKGDENV